MLKLPLSIIYAIIAFNITAFCVLLQLDILIFHAFMLKLLAWTVAVGMWSSAYLNRDRFVTLF